VAEQSKILVVKYDLQSVHKYKPDIVILELGTNDLLTHAPEVVGTKIDDLVHALIKAHIVIQRSGCWGVPGYKPQYSFCTRIGPWLLLPLFCGNIYPWSLLGKMGFLLGFIGNFFEPIVHCYPPMACIVMPKDSTVCIGVRSYRGAILKALKLL
jgi:hypothetical protein